MQGMKKPVNPEKDSPSQPPRNLATCQPAADLLGENHQIHGKLNSARDASGYASAGSARISRPRAEHVAIARLPFH